MQITIPDLEVMLPVVKERRRLNSVRSVRTPKDIIDGNLTEDGYTFKTIKDEDVLNTPLHYLWVEYENALLIPTRKEDLCKCIQMHDVFAGCYFKGNYKKLLKSSYEKVSYLYWLTRTNARMYLQDDEQLPTWQELVQDFDRMEKED